MLPSLWLTYRIHRFEVVLSAILLAALAAWVWLVSSQMLDLDIAATCWPRDVDGNYASPVCDSLMERFWGIRDEARYPRVGLAVVAPVVGLLLGVSIVAREVELRTTDLAWSLALRRSRWLLSRLLPTLMLALIAFIALGFVGGRLFSAFEVGRSGPDLMEVASQGPTLVARGFMALGIALLVGAIIGRTLPAFAVAALVVLAWSLIAMPAIQGSILEERAVWRSGGAWREGNNPIRWLENGVFDASRPGIDGEPGARVAEERLDDLVAEACGPNPEIDEESPEMLAFYECAEESHDSYTWDLIVPASEYGYFQIVEGAFDVAIGGAAMLLTFPLVARRRPS